jgi:hypothetical protein
MTDIAGPPWTHPPQPSAKHSAARHQQARRDRWRPIVIENPIHAFEPRPVAGGSYRPDTVCDGWSTEDFTIRLASIRGYSHRYRGIPRQDDAAITVHEPTGSIVFAVADGVSAAELSHIGATAACRAAVDGAIEELDRQSGGIDWSRVLKLAAWQLVEQAARVLNLSAPDPAEAERVLATTLVAGVLTPTSLGARLTLVQVGDSSAWLLQRRRYRRLLGAKGADGGPVVSSSVDPLPRVPVNLQPVEMTLPIDSVLLIGTDGFGDPLGEGDGRVGRLFADVLAAPGPHLELAYVLDFSRETFDDDRTLLVIWPFPVEDGSV